jgi:hypothetical protein
MTIDTTEAIYFQFEADFVEDNIRCIPMTVRFKLDACGIKLKLAEWSKMNSYEREMLATVPCDNEEAIVRYRKFVEHLVLYRTGQAATQLNPIVNPAWADLSAIPESVLARLHESSAAISVLQWQKLHVLQRFALVKLSASGHEHKNFARALVEFNLV